MPKRSVRGGAAALVFALLVLATLAAFAYSQRQKRDPLVLDRVTFGTPKSRGFTPNGDCSFDKIRIRFRTTISSDGTVQIIRPGGGLILTLAREEFLKRYRFHTFHWDGRDRSGEIAPPGRYKLRVTLLDQDRVLVPPGKIGLHRTPPKPGHLCANTKDSTLVPKP